MILVTGLVFDGQAKPRKASLAVQAPVQQIRIKINV